MGYGPYYDMAMATKWGVRIPPNQFEGKYRYFSRPTLMDMGQNWTLSNWTGTKTLTHIGCIELGAGGKQNGWKPKTTTKIVFYTLKIHRIHWLISIAWFSTIAASLLSAHISSRTDSCSWTRTCSLSPGAQHSQAWYTGNDQIEPLLNTQTLSDSIMLGRSWKHVSTQILVTQWWEKEQPCIAQWLRVANFQLPQFDLPHSNTKH